jgi:hypothetical protein
VSLPLLVLVGATVCPAATPVAGQAGLVAVGKPPSEEAMRRNAEGKQLYRAERWIEARTQYRAALAADPELLGAELNIACSFSRQGRYGEATEVASALVRRSFVPWDREVAEAADLGILQAQAVYARLQAARKEAAVAWGARVSQGEFLIARTKPPLKVVGEGVLVLGLRQEIFAWLPESGRFLQVTAEDGHVLAFAVSPDGRRVAYLLGGKLVRVPGQAQVLRGLALRVLDLSTMALGAPLPLAGDVTRVELAFGTQPLLRATDAAGEVTDYVPGESGLERKPQSEGARLREPVAVTAAGVAPAADRTRRGKCRYSLAMQKDPKGTWRIAVTPGGGKPFLLDTRYGAGLRGMPFPSAEPSRATGSRKQ